MVRERKNFSTTLPTALIQSLRIMALDQDRNMNDVLAESIQDIVEKFTPDQGTTRRPIEGAIRRSIEFPPEYVQAGVLILSHFSTVLRRKYPEKNAKVRIEQDGLKVKLVIDPDEGEAETIERALDEYGLLVTGKIRLEEYTNDPFLMMELKNQAIVTQALIETQRNTIAYQDSQMQAKDIRIDGLISVLGKALSRTSRIEMSVPVTNIIENHQKVVFTDVNSLQDSLDDILGLLNPGAEEVAQIGHLRHDLNQIGSCEDPNELKDSPAMSRFSEFITGLKNAESKIGKILKQARDGVKIVRKLSAHFSSIADWCGFS